MSFAKARRSIPKLSKELTAAVATGTAPRPATTLVTSGHSSAQSSADTQQLYTSASSSSVNCAKAPIINADQVTEVIREAGFAPELATTLAAVCAYAPLQEALWESIQDICEQDNLGLMDSVLSEAGVFGGSDDIGKGKERVGCSSVHSANREDGSCEPASMRDYDHYKLKTHSFNEYRSEQDIADLLQVEEDFEGRAGYVADDWNETTLGCRSDSRSLEDSYAAGRGHAGEPGGINEDSKWFAYLLVSVTLVLSLCVLRVKNPGLFSVAVQSDLVKAVASLSEGYAA